MMFWSSFLLLLLGFFGTAGALVARCPTPGSTDPLYCSCQNNTISIRCDFKMREDVVLTRELLAPYDGIRGDTAYVRVVNATTVNVTGDFVQRWLEVSSAAFDIWHSGVVTLNAPQGSDSNDTERTAGRFAGIGIIDCTVPEVPPGFLRDRTRGAFRIKDSKVGVIREGFIENVHEVRYIVLEDSEVNVVEGSVAAEGYVTLSQLVVHSWNGLVLSNVTIHEMGSGAFNLAHKADMEVVNVQGCYIGHMASGALAASGDFHVTIRNNTFRYLDSEAFRVNVSGSVYFINNLMVASGLDALRALNCHNSSSIQNNTIVIPDPYHITFNQTTTPFQPSCGKPQLFLVLSPLRRMMVLEDTRAAWVLGAALAVLIMVLAVGVAWMLRRRRPVLSRDRFPILHKGQGHTASLDNLPRNIELSISRDDPEEGTSVNDDLTGESQENDASLRFDAEYDDETGAVHSDSSCDAASS